MGDQSRFERPSGPDRRSRRGRIFVLTLLAVALIVPLGVYETIPVKQHKATPPPPDPTAQAIRGLQTSLQQAVEQLKALQQTVSSDQAESKRLSDQINGLARKLEALQQSFASAQQAPAVQPTEPPGQNRDNPMSESTRRAPSRAAQREATRPNAPVIPDLRTNR
jgi:uncharacterized protein HemX